MSARGESSYIVWDIILSIVVWLITRAFIGVSSFYIGINNLQDAQKPKSCDLAKIAQDMFVKTQMNMGRGGGVDANTAKMVLQYTGQYAPSADQMVKQYCKGK